MDKPFSSYLRKLAEEVPDLSQTPLFGNAPSFNWPSFSQKLTKELQIEGFSVQFHSQKWKEEKEIKESLGARVSFTPLKLLPISSPLFWAMNQSSMDKLNSWILNGQVKGPKFSSEFLKEGFYRFLLLQAIDTLSETEPFQSFTFELEENTEIVKEGAFCVDLEISFEGASIFGTVILPDLFRKSWVEHFSSFPPKFRPSMISKNAAFNVAIKTGMTLVSQKEWKEVKAGDFLLLERNSYDPKRHQGIALLTLGKTPLFQTKIKQNKIELLDYASYYEEFMEDGQINQEKTEEAREETLSSIQDIPLTITVEIARLKMTLDELVQLKPGNQLDLPVHPDQGVSLSVNGKVIGKGELVHLGETLGVRLLELG